MRRSILLALLLLVLPPDVAFAQRTFPGGTPTASGSGTANTLMKFDSAGNAADSSLTDDGSTVTSTADLALGSNSLIFTSSTFVLDAANALALRNGANAQTFRLYNTYTDADNYERLAIGAAANIFTIAPEEAGSGTIRQLRLSTGTTDGTVSLAVGATDVFSLDNSSGLVARTQLIWGTDNANNIGLSGSNRPQSGYFGTSVVVGSAANGAEMGWKRATTVVAAAAGASITTATTVPAGIIPAGARVAFVVTRITTAFGVTGSLASIDIGDGTDVDMFGNDVAITLNATTNGANHTATPGLYAAATHVVLTGVGGTFDTTGAIRVTVFYTDSTAPTS